MNPKPTDPHPRPGQGGFVLVAVLALLVVLSLLAAAVAVASQRAVAEAQLELDAFQGELDMLSTRDTLLFLASTQRMTLGGLTVNEAASRRVVSADDDIEGLEVMPVGDEIRLDATPYAGIGHALFSVQDGRGLFNPNWAGPALRQSFYDHLGAAAEDWASLDAKRLDYQDPDLLHRLGGAEAREYAAAGLPPPSNRPLASPMEFRRILGWDNLLENLTDDDLAGMLGVERNVVLNVNTAPAQVLALLPGVDRAMADRVVALRQQAPFTSLAQVQQLMPVRMGDEEGVTLFSNPSGNLILWDSRQGARRLIHWTMTPFDEQGRPWRIDYEVILPRGKQPDPGMAKPPATPLFPAPDAAGE